MSDGRIASSRVARATTPEEGAALQRPESMPSSHPWLSKQAGIRFLLRCRRGFTHRTFSRVPQMSTGSNVP